MCQTFGYSPVGKNTRLCQTFGYSPVGKNTSVKYQTSGCAKRLVIYLSVRTQCQIPNIRVCQTFGYSPVGKNTSVKYQTSGCAKRLVIYLSVRTQVSNTKHQGVPNVWLFTCVRTQVSNTNHQVVPNNGYSPVGKTTRLCQTLGYSPVGKNTSVKYQTSGCAKCLVIYLSVRTQVSNTKHQVVPNVWLFTCR